MIPAKTLMHLDLAPFRRAGLGLSLDEFERLVMDAVAQVLPERAPIDGRADMTGSEASFLRDAGVDLSEFAPREHGAESPLAAKAAEDAAILPPASRLPELAKRLHGDESSVRQRLVSHRLYGIKVGKGWRVPLFELDDTGQALV